MTEFDKGIKSLEILAALSTYHHVEYLKSKGKRSRSIGSFIQEWEAGELVSDKNKLSTRTTMRIEALMLELVAKELKQEVERMGNKEKNGMREVTIEIDEDAYNYFKALAEECNWPVEDYIAWAAWTYFKMDSKGEI